MGMLRRISQSTDRVVRFRMLVPGVVGIGSSDPDVVQEVLVEHAKSFDKAAMMRFSLWNLAGEGLFTSDGELWKRQRKLVAPLFTPRALEAYVGDMLDCAERTVATWQDGQTIRLIDETTRLTMGVAGKTLFDVDTFSSAEEIGAALHVVFDWTSWISARPFSVGHVMLRRALQQLAEVTRPASVRHRVERAADHLRGPIALIGSRGRQFAHAITFLDGRVQSMIDERRRVGTGTHSDLLARLLEARDEDGTAMTDRQVRDEVLTLFVAGHETTASSLAWTLYYACRNPEVYAAMEREADAVGDRPTAKDLPMLGTCLRAFKESLRIAPPVYVFGRDARVPVAIGGYQLPAFTNVLISPWVLHHSPRLWPDPDRFDPDRFRPEAESTRHRYAYLPFGAGPRICIGVHFAYMEAQLALTVLLRRYRFELLGDEQPLAGATLRPTNGVRMRVHRRARSSSASG